MLVEVDFACNDERGMDTGRAERIEIGNLSLVGGYVALKQIGPRHVRVGRLKILFGHYKYGVGNWCWDGYWIRKSDALRLISYLQRQAQWHCEEASTEQFDKFEKKLAFTNDDLLAVMDRAIA